MMHYVSHRVFGGSFTGRKPKNEDSLFPNTEKSESAELSPDRFYIVCDGIGRMPSGKLASYLASQTIADVLTAAEEITPARLHQAFEEAHKTICENRPPAGTMGTTVCVVVITRAGYLVANIGDSRAYIFRHGNEVYRSKDDTKVQEMYRNGLISAEQAHDHPEKNLLTYALLSSPDSAFQPVIEKISPLTSGDRLLLCTDGVWECFPGGRPDAYMQPGNDLKTAYREIRKRCIERNHDNYSFFLVGDFIPTNY